MKPTRGPGAGDYRRTVMGSSCGPCQEVVPDEAPADPRVFHERSNVCSRYPRIIIRVFRNLCYANVNKRIITMQNTDNLFIIYSPRTNVPETIDAYPMNTTVSYTTDSEKFLFDTICKVLNLEDKFKLSKNTKQSTSTLFQNIQIGSKCTIQVSRMAHH